VASATFFVPCRTYDMACHFFILVLIPQSKRWILHRLRALRLPPIMGQTQTVLQCLVPTPSSRISNLNEEEAGFCASMLPWSNRQRNTRCYVPIRSQVMYIDPVDWFGQPSSSWIEIRWLDQRLLTFTRLGSLVFSHYQITKCSWWLRACLDWSHQLPGQLFGVDWGHGQAFGWKPRFPDPSNLLASSSVLHARSWRDEGAQIVRQIIGKPTFWKGEHGCNPNRPWVLMWICDGLPQENYPYGLWKTASPDAFYELAWRIQWWRMPTSFFLLTSFHAVVLEEYPDGSRVDCRKTAHVLLWSFHRGRRSFSVHSYLWKD
jgi:hypothetical protein